MNFVDKVLALARDEKDNEEIRRGIKALASEFKRRSGAEDAVAVIAFAPGDKVVVLTGSRRLPTGAPGTVEKVCQRNLLVDFGDFQTWRLPPSMVKKVDRVEFDRLKPTFGALAPAFRRNRHARYEETPPHLA